MRRAILLFSAAFCLGTLSVYSHAATAKSPNQAVKAKITMPQARKIALKAFPGKILHQELEHEKGGSGLRYSFDIKHGSTVHEVGVDAVTGKVLENDVDND